MGTFGGLISIAGSVALMTAIASSIYYFVKRHRSHGVTVREGFVYAAGLLVLTLGAWVIGTIFGISVACSSPTSGNLCGLIAIFGIGPLFSAIALFSFAKWWAARTVKAL